MIASPPHPLKLIVGPGCSTLLGSTPMGSLWSYTSLRNQAVEVRQPSGAGDLPTFRVTGTSSPAWTLEVVGGAWAVSQHQGPWLSLSYAREVKTAPLLALHRGRPTATTRWLLAAWLRSRGIAIAQRPEPSNIGRIRGAIHQALDHQAIGITGDGQPRLDIDLALGPEASRLLRRAYPAQLAQHGRRLSEEGWLLSA